MKTLTKKTLILKGLHCAGCAAKIEEAVSKIQGVQNASVDIISKRMILEIEDENRVEVILQEASETAVRIESHVEVIADSHVEKESKEESNEGITSEVKNMIFSLLFASVFLGLTFIFDLPTYAKLVLFFTAYAVVGREVILSALKNIGKRQLFDENFLMFIATIGAFIIGEYEEAIGVMFFYQIGELFQSLAVQRSTKSIAQLMNIRPEEAAVLRCGEWVTVHPEEVITEEVLLVKPGEKVPLDGNVIDGETMLDTSALTGESIPRKVSVGDEVLAGMVNINGVIQMTVTKEYNESTVAKILDLVQHASSKKAPTEKFITTFAKYYTPVVVFSALALAILPPLFIPNAQFSTWLYRALIFLVVSCPCALVISIPLGFFGGIGGASRHGILIKGGNFLEALHKADTVVFDKTGTLTKGEFSVSQIVPSKDFSDKELLRYAALAESFSNHPIAKALLKVYDVTQEQQEVKIITEKAGYGIETLIYGKKVLVGNDKLMIEWGIQCNNVKVLGTVVQVAVDGIYAGYILIKDEIKEDAKAGIENLKALGIKRIIMLTGDRPETAQKVANDLGIDEVYANLLPHQKVEKLEEIESLYDSNKKVIFVGDGINDAPVLARADVGVAMGGLGSDAAIEAADVVLMTDEVTKLALAIKTANRTAQIVKQNIIFALSIKALVMIMGIFGAATMWEGVFADVGVALLAVLNSMRVLKEKK